MISILMFIQMKKSKLSLEFLLCTMATPLKHAFLHFLLGGLETNLI